MSHEELKLILQDYLKYLPMEKFDLCYRLIQALDKLPERKPVGMIERCVFCGQVIPSKGGKQ